MKQWMKCCNRAAAAALALLLCAASAAAAQAEDGPPFPQAGQLEVRGQAIRTVLPDTVDITIGATAQKDSERDALNDVNEVIANVIASLKALNIPENQIKTTWLDISPRYGSSAFGSTRPIVGYTASVSLTVTLKDFEKINTAIDAAVAQGANNLGSMRFSFSEEGLAYRQALDDAITVAREKAETMAAAAGVKLGSLLLLREGGYNTYPYANAYIQEMEAAAAPSDRLAESQIMAGEIQISASVDLMYETR